MNNPIFIYISLQVEGVEGILMRPYLTFMFKLRLENPKQIEKVQVEILKSQRHREFTE